MRFLSRVVFVVLLSTGALTLHGCGKSKNKKTDDNDAEPATVTVSEPDPTEVSSEISSAPAASPSEDIKPAEPEAIVSSGGTSSPPPTSNPPTAPSQSGIHTTNLRGSTPPASTDASPTSSSAAVPKPSEDSQPKPKPKASFSMKPAGPPAVASPKKPADEGEFEALPEDVDDDDGLPVDLNDEELNPGLINRVFSLDDFKARFDFQNLSANDLPPNPRIMNVNPSGDCLFRAVSVGLNGSPAGHVGLRRGIAFSGADYLRNAIINRLALFGYDPARNNLQEAWVAYERSDVQQQHGAPQGCRTIEDYIQEMSQPKRWGGDAEIDALSQLINRQIIVVARHAVSRHPEQPLPGSDGPIYIIHNGNHFIGVLPPDL